MMAIDTSREYAIKEYRKKINEHRQVEAKLKEGLFRSVTLHFFSKFFFCLAREQLKELNKQYEKSENDLKALQSVGQIVGEVLKQLTDDNCMSMLF